MRNLAIRRIFCAAGLIGVGALVGSAVVWAQGSRSAAQITACVDPATGVLSIGACRSTSLTWNTDGPPGATGPTGAAGGQGPAGPSGPSGTAVTKVVEGITKNSVPSFEAFVKCPAAMVALGGGGWPQGLEATISTTYPYTKYSGKTLIAAGWVVGVKNPKGTNTYAHVFAICAPVAKPGSAQLPVGG
jgi:hypothetical protein